MRITMLGTGTGLIRPERRSPSVLIETENNQSVIVDCGWGVPDALNSLGFALHTLNHICISHSHADHMSALPALLQSTLIANIAHLPGEARDGYPVIHGYAHITHDITMLMRMMSPELSVAEELKIFEYTKHERRFADLTISAQSVRHVPNLAAISFLFQADNKKIFVSGDMGWDESVLPRLQEADMAILDASASQQEHKANPHRSHLAPIQCGMLAARAGVKHLVLTSLYDRETPAEIENAVRQHFAGKLTIPQDLHVFNLD